MQIRNFYDGYQAMYSRHMSKYFGIGAKNFHFASILPKAGFIVIYASNMHKMPKFDTHEDILDRSSPNDIVQHQNWELLEILRNQRWSRKR